MYSSLRQRLFLALSLTCAAAPTACKKDDGEATPVDNEGPKKKKPKDPEPEPKKVKVWTLEGSPTKPVACGYVRFCSNQPAKLAFASDASALYAHCGGTVKVPKEARIEGFPEDFNASFNEPVTEEQRKKTDPDACCYGYATGPCGKGRPLRDADGFVLAEERATSGWTGVDVTAAAAEVSDVESFVRYFRPIARLEHGSVAAFASVSLDLMSLGAPADLVEAAHIAALDEIRHARVCWSLVAELTGEGIGPASMAIPARAPLDREQMLIATVVDGCVGETLGSLLFAKMAENAPPRLAGIYRIIADEEARHAELAFRIAQFLIGDDARLVEVARCAAETAVRAPDESLLTHEVQREVMDRGFAEVVWPVMLGVAA